MPTTGFAGLSWVLKSVMITSLALNLLVVGALATAWYRHGGKHFHHGGGVERSLMHYARRELPREKWRELKKAWRKERESLRPLFEDVRAARKNVGTVLQAETYDRSRVEAALDQVRQKRIMVRQSVLPKFLDQIETLTEEERRAFGQFIQEDRRGKWRRHRRWRHRD